MHGSDSGWRSRWPYHSQTLLRSRSRALYDQGIDQRQVEVEADAEA